MSELVKRQNSEIAQYNAGETAVAIVAAEHAEKVAVNIKDVEGIRSAVERKLNEQRTFAAIMRNEFPIGRNDRSGYDGTVAPKWCASYGFHIRSVQRWGKYLLDSDFGKILDARTAKCMQVAGLDIKALDSSEIDEWYTPPEFIEAARETMGSIDLDPASNSVANETVKAKGFFTKEDDGYKRDWLGNIWLNPPYGRTDGQSNQQLWVNKLIQEFSLGHVKQACLLVNAVPGNAWFSPLWDYMICFVYRRIRFNDPSGQQGQPTHSNVIVYMGENRQEFINAYSVEGAVVERLPPDVV